MGNGKGKARAVSDGDDIPTTTEASLQYPSILSSVAKSARGLTRSAFTAPTIDEVSNLAAIAPSDSVKGRLPETNDRHAALGESSNQDQLFNHKSSDGARVRVGHSEEHIRKTENDFASFLDGTDSFPSTDDANRSHFNDGNYTSNTGLGEIPPTLSTENFRPIVRMSVSEQERHDGAEVSAILSAPSADEEDFAMIVEEGEKHDWGMSPEQLSHLKRVTREIFPENRAHGDVAPNNPLNLIPDLQSGSSSQMTGLSNTTALNQWMDQWESVLTRYTDEVWGGLLPLVQDARQEIGNDKEQNGSNLKALKRLEAILGHLRRG